MILCLHKMNHCAKCGTPQSRFLCKCTARYCSPACQKGHWPDHKAECRAIRFKVEMDQTIQGILRQWDESEGVCFLHYPKGEVSGMPSSLMNLDGFVGLLKYDAVEAIVSQNQPTVRSKEWSLEISGAPVRIISIMIEFPGKPADRILQQYAPELALPGWGAFHFLSYEKVALLMGPLMDVT